MRLTVSFLPSHRLPVGLDPATATAIVVDVLRATSVMSAALASGARRFVTFESVEAARQWAAGEADHRQRPLLCGERHCQPIDGFDLGNSPAEYTVSKVQNRTLAMTTTNGTRALAAAANFQHVVAASFLNLSAVSQRIRDRAAVHVLCAGTDGAITGEDVLLAGALAARCRDRQGATLENDEARLAAELWRAGCGSATGGELAERVAERLADSQGGRNLQRVGMGDDIRRCSQVDSVAVVPTVIAREPIMLSEEESLA